MRRPACLIQRNHFKETTPMAAEKQEIPGRSLTSDTGSGRTNGGDIGATALGQQAAQALEGLRSVIEQASQVLRDLTQAGGQWSQSADRAREMAQGLRNQGEQYVGTVSRQVEQNPMISIAVAFAMGYLLATLTRR
jgi:ElaB/YqjD/DUF883 family membrane-anchored ribosome-binding protein